MLRSAAGRVRPDDEVGAAQGVEVGGVVRDVEGAVEQLAQQLRRPRRVHVVDGVGGLGGGHVVRFRADAADAVGQRRHLLDGAADAEPLEAAQLGDLEVGVGDLAVRIEEDLDLAVAFEPGDGVDGDSFHARLLPVVLPGRPAAAEQRTRQAEAVELADRIDDAVEHLVDLARAWSRRRPTRRPTSGGLRSPRRLRRLRSSRCTARRRPGRGRRSRCGSPGRCRAGPARAGRSPDRTGDLLDADELVDLLDVALAGALVADGASRRRPGPSPWAAAARCR